MLSGLHTVEDIFCCCCGQILGWKYVWFLHLSGLVVCWDGQVGAGLESETSKQKEKNTETQT